MKLPFYENLGTFKKRIVEIIMIIVYCSNIVFRNSKFVKNEQAVLSNQFLASAYY